MFKTEAKKKKKKLQAVIKLSANDNILETAVMCTLFEMLKM